MGLDRPEAVNKIYLLTYCINQYAHGNLLGSSTVKFTLDTGPRRQKILSETRKEAPR